MASLLNELGDGGRAEFARAAVGDHGRWSPPASRYEHGDDDRVSEIVTATARN